MISPGLALKYLSPQNVIFEVEAALPAEVAALLGGVAVVGEFARHRGKAVGTAQPGEHAVNGGWPAGEDAAQAALLADAVLLKVLASLIAAYVLGDSDHAAAVHFVEDEFLLSLPDLAFDLEVVFQAVLTSGQQQDLNVDEPLKGLALKVAWGVFGKEPGRRRARRGRARW